MDDDFIKMNKTNLIDISYFLSGQDRWPCSYMFRFQDSYRLTRVRNKLMYISKTHRYHG